MKVILALIILCLLLRSDISFAQSPPFYDEIQNFKKAGQCRFSAGKCYSFYWQFFIQVLENLPSYFPGYNVLNRGFGGSTIKDVIYYAKDILLPYKPKQVIIYCGENDLASSDSITPDTVLNRFAPDVSTIRRRPNAKVSYVSIKPSPSRYQLWSKMMEANQQD